MSCLWIWRCRGREDDSDTDSKEKEEQQSEKRKKGKRRSGRKWRIHWKKGRKSRTNKEDEEKEQKPVKVEEEAHALDLPVGLASSLSAETLEATAPPPQGSLTGEEGAAIQQLLKTLLDEDGARMGQLLKAETAQIVVAREAAAEATNTMNIVLEECEEKHLEDAEANDQTYPDLEDPVPTDIHPLGDERLKDHVAEPETAKEHLDLKETSFSDDQPLDVKKSCPPENDKTNKRKTRRGTRGKGRKIIYNKDKHPDVKLDGQRGSSGHTNDGKNCGPECSEEVRPRRVNSEWDGPADDVPHTLTIWKTGWTEETAEEGLHWLQESIKSCAVDYSWPPEFVREACNIVPFNLTYWRTGFFQNGANEHLKPGAKPERQTWNQKELENQK
ncbi:hypothetical protein SRHO_G00257290 [Serrasalmus rhombeus]